MEVRGMKSVKLMMAVTIPAAAVGIIAFPGVANAHSEHCSVNGMLNPPFQSCTTAAVQAHPNGWLDVAVWPYSGCSASYYIWDARNQEIIHRETTRGVSKTLFGVHSWYHLKVTFPGWRCGGDAILDND
jgi:hypothetical protein